MNKVLILGAAGLLGRYVRAELSAAELHVYAQSRSKNNGCEQVFDPSVPEVLRDRLAAIRPDVVVNTTAITRVDFCEDHLEEAYCVNTRVAESLAAWASECAPACHIIQISTDQLYSRKGYQREADVDLLNVYALTKYAAEIALRGLPKHTILRTNFFGRSLDNARQSFSDWIFEALVQSAPIRLATDIEFNPLSLPTLARYIAAVVAHPMQGVFNVGSRTSLSKHAFGLRFAEALSLPPDCIEACTATELGFQVRRPLDMRMDVSRFEELQGSMPALEDEIARSSVDYIGENDR